MPRLLEPAWLIDNKHPTDIVCLTKVCRRVIPQVERFNRINDESQKGENNADNDFRVTPGKQTNLVSTQNTMY